jgi:hypothetical protein
LLFPEQKNECEKQCSFGNWGAPTKKVISLSLSRVKNVSRQKQYLAEIRALRVPNQKSMTMEHKHDSAAMTLQGN